ncbi:hypothetical protein GGI20_000999 [Coemansia sp. BCRC 34301]|nr:hypothetical protein GGI20_000999 [Coemansia sp. BCRC 34301]
MLTPSTACTKEPHDSGSWRLDTVCDSSSNSESVEDSQTSELQRQLVFKPRTGGDELTPATQLPVAGSLGREQQTRILFVTLLESYLRTYDDDPLRNRRLFFGICRTLFSMGIISKEYVDEMAPVRASYSEAFRQLVLRAQQSLDMYEHHDIESGIRSLVTSMTEDSESESLEDYSSETDEYSSEYGERKYATVPASRCSSRAPPMSSCSNGDERMSRDVRWLRRGSVSVLSSSSTSNTFETMIMDMQRSRYQDDFVQLRTLGRGGFGRVFEARNKLDGRRYAVKQIKVKGQVTADKTLRETKTLAGLEHPNIVRYYSSWIEVAQQFRRPPPTVVSCQECSPSPHDNLGDYHIEDECRDMKECPDASDGKQRVDSCSSSLSLSSSSSSLSSASANPPLALMGLFAGGPPSSSCGGGGGGMEWFNDGDEPSFDIVPADPFDSSDIVFENSNEPVSEEHVEFAEDCDTSTLPLMRSYPIPIKNAFHRRQRSLLINGCASPSSSSARQQLFAQSFPSHQQQQAGSSGGSDSAYSMVVGETTLYIQMQMCQTTLQQFISERNRRIGKEGQCPLIDPVLNVRLFRAIVEGVRYFHARGVIHRDLKGANVFVDIAYADSGGNPISRCTSDIGRPSCVAVAARQAFDELETVVMRDVHSDAWDAIDGGNLKEHCASAGVQMNGGADSDNRNVDWDSVFASILAPSAAGEATETPRAEGEAVVPPMVTLIPRIGDFGLATKTTLGVRAVPESSGGQSPLTGTNSPSPHTLPKNHRRTSNVGTITYAAPEQLEDQATAYSEKADIYSLGIIFFELYYAFSTSMERVVVIGDLRRGVFPERFIREWPKEAAFVSRLMDAVPERRPSAREILAMDLMDVPTLESAQLKKEVVALKQQLRMACLRNEELGLRVRELERIVDKWTV